MDCKSALVNADGIGCIHTEFIQIQYWVRNGYSRGSSLIGIRSWNTHPVFLGISWVSFRLFYPYVNPICVDMHSILETQVPWDKSTAGVFAGARSWSGHCAADTCDQGGHLGMLSGVPAGTWDVECCCRMLWNLWGAPDRINELHLHVATILVHVEWCYETMENSFLFISSGFPLSQQGPCENVFSNPDSM